jgi:hypothetical protein
MSLHMDLHRFILLARVLHTVCYRFRIVINSPYSRLFAALAPAIDRFIITDSEHSNTIVE